MPTQRILLGAALFAAALAAQNQKSVAGTVTEFKALEIGIKADSGEAAFLQFGVDTQVVAVTPGERDLNRLPAAVTDIVVGDRSWRPRRGLTPARRIVLITGRRHRQRRGRAAGLRGARNSGVVNSVTGDQILLEIRAPEGGIW